MSNPLEYFNPKVSKLEKKWTLVVFARAESFHFFLQAAREAEEKMRKKKEEVEAAEREKLAAEKAEKEEMKKALKKQRQTVRKICKTNNYFIQTDKELVPHMSNIEKMCDMYSLDE